jgi:hypothetical protein
MDWATIGINVLFTLIFLWLLIWTLFAWGFGITNFKQKHSKLMGRIGNFLWYALAIGHVIAIYMLWATSISIIWLVTLLLVFHVFYGFTFARNVSTR